MRKFAYTYIRIRMRTWYIMTITIRSLDFPQITLAVFPGATVPSLILFLVTYNLLPAALPSIHSTIILLAISFLIASSNRNDS